MPPNAPRRQRRERTVYSQEQKQILEEYFRNHQHPSYEERQELARKICVDEYQVKIWFKNRRAKYSREHPEEPLHPPSGTQANPEAQGPSRSLAAAPASEDSACSDPSGCSYIPQVEPGPGFFRLDPSSEGPWCSAQENTLTGQASVVTFSSPFPRARAADPGQSQVSVASPNPVIGEAPTSVEAPVTSATSNAALGEAPAATAAQKKESAEELWIRVLDDLNTILDPGFRLVYPKPIPPEEIFLALCEEFGP